MHPKCLKDLSNHPRLSGLFTQAALSLAVSSKNKCLQFYHCASVSVLACLITLLIIKITISSLVIGLKNVLFSTNSLAKLLLDSLLLDSLLSDS